MTTTLKRRTRRLARAKGARPARRKIRRTRTAGAPTNAEMAAIFREVADLLELDAANQFRIRAYRNAARSVEECSRPIAALAAESPEELTELPGVGDDLAAKIREISRTGSLALLRQLRRAAPAGAARLLRLPGVGPKHARALCEQLGVRSLASLRRAAVARRIRDLPGFGEKTETRILAEIDTRAAHGGRSRRASVAEHAEALLTHLRAVPGVRRAEIAGSYRRACETVGDLDVLVTGTDHAAIVAAFVGYGGMKSVLARGTTRAAIRLRSGLHVDLRVLDAKSFGAGLHYFTGSKAHNVAVRRMARERGLKINEYGVFRGTRRRGGSTEEEVFAAVGLPWIPPELREDRGELEAAARGELPELLEGTDLRGDLQSHTTHSDGRDSLEAMAEAAEALGYEYLAITDHTPSVRVAGGLDDDGFRRQMKRIDRLNARLRKLTLLKGAEVDIRADGSLDLRDTTLAALDIVLVSVHSHFRLPRPEQTARVLRALTHPAVDVLAHPTARLIGQRPPIALDIDAVCQAAADGGKLLEVNAQPERLDLDDIATHTALRRGVTLTLGTDAHSVEELGFMHWGVDQARRGWATRTDVANTLPLAKLLRLLHDARRAARRSAAAPLRRSRARRAGALE